MTFSAIVVAAGSGSRAGGDGPGKCRTARLASVAQDLSGAVVTRRNFP